MEPLQDVTFTVPRPVLEEGDAFLWTVCVSQLSIYSLLGQQRSLSVLEPVGCTSTLALTAPKLQPDSRDAFIMCLHVDLQPVHLKCSNPQGDSAHIEDPASGETMTLEQKTCSISSASGKLSIWMQWMLAEESPCGGVVLSCTEKLNRRTVLLRQLSKQEPYSHFSFFPPVRAAASVCTQTLLLQISDSGCQQHCAHPHSLVQFKADQSSS
ncbi:vacuolar protein sorting-associated protein 13B-like [Sinocyclocheilus rhinocerous]|uniref:vacuolar protein sorting-associated protein 13B-like n=1 Tax=Sinocyclocheilus rhinocerous TaxID=307959 RepID=UPI0007B9B87A|nr:PREDICTED: vacuolar protein sorting-associated protein 13B-like [Sinocyclocheilus rhinocerous]